MDILLSGRGLSRADFPGYPFRGQHMAGVPSGIVALRLLGTQVGKESDEKKAGNV